MLRSLVGSEMCIRDRLCIASSFGYLPGYDEERCVDTAERPLGGTLAVDATAELAGWAQQSIS